MPIICNELSRVKEPWGIDVTISFDDELTGASLQTATFNFTSEEDIDALFDERMTKAIDNLTLERPNLETAGCPNAGGTCNKDCNHDYKYTFEQIGDKVTIDLKEGPRAGTLTIGDVERILRAKGIMLPGEKWGEFTLREVKNG